MAFLGFSLSSSRFGVLGLTQVGSKDKTVKTRDGPPLLHFVNFRPYRTAQSLFAGLVSRDFGALKGKAAPYKAALRTISGLDLVAETPTYYTCQSCKTSAKQQEGARLRNRRDTDGVEFKITGGVLRDEG